MEPSMKEDAQSPSPYSNRNEVHPLSFGSAQNLEGLTLKATRHQDSYADNDVNSTSVFSRPMHEITFSTIDIPKLLKARSYTMMFHSGQLSRLPAVLEEGFFRGFYNNCQPFRLRTDERWILKEAILERKLNLPAHEKEVTKDISLIKKRMPVGSKPVPNTTQQRPKASLMTRSSSIHPQPEGVASPRKKIRRPCLQLGEIKEKSSKLTGDEVAGLNIHEAHVFSTNNGYSLDVFLVDGWPLQETKALHVTMERAIARSEGSWSDRYKITQTQPHSFRVLLKVWAFIEAWIPGKRYHVETEA
ncbi:unnamed protein product [Lactuca virosa]|uniref:Uncharacterized protein n=1 Tax=Lactuca virosa TaxID=75947 RepID=A0AAU9PPY4_9ASTR|nr:unnamed protein product [Lactuca virosa]